MTASMVHAAIAAALLLIILPTSIIADRWCNLMRNAGCSAPFVPGHKWMGDAWWAIGDGQTTIIQLSTTLMIPEPPNNVGGVIAINAAMENTEISDTSDTNLVPQTFQAIVAAYPEGWTACGQNTSEWCAFQSIYTTTLDPPQVNHKPYPKTSGQVSLVWTYDPSKQQIWQSADSDGLSMQTLEPPRQWWPKTECQCSAKGNIPAHQYVSTTIVLETANPDYASAVSGSRSGNSGLYTSDGGKTWQIDSIHLDDAWCENTEECPPAGETPVMPNYTIDVEVMDGSMPSTGPTQPMTPIQDGADHPPRQRRWRG